MKKDPTFADALKRTQEKLEREGHIKDGKLTPKGWALFEKQWRACKSRKPN